LSPVYSVAFLDSSEVPRFNLDFLVLVNQGKELISQRHEKFAAVTRGRKNGRSLKEEVARVLAARTSAEFRDKPFLA
jgi:hypothetical protein